VLPLRKLPALLPVLPLRKLPVLLPAYRPLRTRCRMKMQQFPCSNLQCLIVP
jgi:hypothetical protein